MKGHYKRNQEKTNNASKDVPQDIAQTTKGEIPEGWSDYYNRLIYSTTEATAEALTYTRNLCHQIAKKHATTKRYAQDAPAPFKKAEAQSCLFSALWLTWSYANSIKDSKQHESQQCCGKTQLSKYICLYTHALSFSLTQTHTHMHTHSG